MGKFLEIEKTRQVTFKASSPYFSAAARADGVYRKTARPFCLPVDHAEENLFSEIRESAPAYFASHGIKWHDGANGKPSNHLCSSQVCCLNFLFPFANQPRALAHILRSVFPSIRVMLPIEDGQYIACEWIGEKNYLDEKIHHGSRRTRGAHFTSADAAVMFEQTDGTRQIVLIEWKYTESYPGTPLKKANSGTDRTAIYKRLFEPDDCPIHKELLPSFDSLFYEPFYQFMRQQFLAREMERFGELGASKVSILHISPAVNTGFQVVTSLELQALGDKATGIWKRLVKPHDRFISVTTEELFGGLSVSELPEMQAWLDYIFMRYPWARACATSSVSTEAPGPGCKPHFPVSE